ncbi:MAG: hypothetical protein EXR91_01675 [Gemmatimonadetes bacterium]|nr:hypothetical protein [Gemmatimonadota bacterium]
MATKRRRLKRDDNRIIEWRSGRAYGDFRAYTDVGGSKMALAEPGKTWATTDEAIAAVLYDAELERLELARRRRRRLLRLRRQVDRDARAVILLRNMTT